MSYPSLEKNKDFALASISKGKHFLCIYFYPHSYNELFKQSRCSTGFLLLFYLFVYFITGYLQGQACWVNSGVNHHTFMLISGTRQAHTHHFWPNIFSAEEVLIRVLIMDLFIAVSQTTRLARYASFFFLFSSPSHFSLIAIENQEMFSAPN